MSYGHRDPKEQQDFLGLPCNADYLGLGFKVAMTALWHPKEYAKTLMQLGYEPIPPHPTKTIFGRPALGLPSVFKYIRVIKKRDGVLGLYTGLTPRLCSLGITEVVTNKFDSFWPQKQYSFYLGSREVSEEENQKRFVEEIKRGAALKVTCVIITHPLQVIAVRAMAQFVGRETKYDGILGGIKEVINENGILGFFYGLIPRALAEVALVILANGLTFCLNRFVLHDKDIQQYTHYFTDFMALSLVYPFHVVSNCSIVSRSGLAAGYPPHMPFYRDWTDCFRHLSSQNQLKRGSSLFFRYYTGPQVIVGNQVLPVNRSVFKLD